ncbi:MAG TPA: hypothetical protein VFS05_15180 [Gemmatimonadaceae bacterium]|nr:hypothetical protein [Gemmatimonadaceae bacterium]
MGRQGFGSEDEARRAARAAFTALCGWLARQRRADAIPNCRRALAARRDGRLTFLTLGGIPVGRLLPPGDEALLGAPAWGFELLLPPSLDGTLGLSAARVIDAALSRRAAALELETAAAGA